MAPLYRASIFILTVLFWVPVVAAQTQFIQINEKGLLSGDIQDVEIGRIVDELERQHKLDVEGKELLPNDVVTSTFKNQTLEDLLKRIFSAANYSLVFNKSGKPTKIIILGKPSPKVQQTPSPRPNRFTSKPKPTTRRIAKGSSPFNQPDSSRYTPLPQPSKNNSQTSQIEDFSPKHGVAPPDAFSEQTESKKGIIENFQPRQVAPGE